MPSSGEQRKGGKKGRKVGRNKDKCKMYRIRHKQDDEQHSHRKRRVFQRPGFIIDDHLVPEHKMTAPFKPVGSCPHLATEYYETGKRTPGGYPGQRRGELDAEDITRQLFDRLQERVLIVPKRDKATEQRVKRVVL